MPRGKPDYDNSDNQISVSSLSNEDLAAAMLGHTRVDGRGRVVWRDDFNMGLNRWILGKVGNGSYPRCDVDSGSQLALSPSIAFNLNDNTGQSFMDTFINIGGTKRMGIEFAVMPFVNSGEFQIHLKGVYTLGVERIGRIKVKASTINFNIETTTGDVVIKSPSVASDLWSRWVYIKGVIDVEQAKWVRLIIGGEEFDLSTYSTIGSSTYMQGHVGIRFWNIPQSVVLKEKVLLSHVIITADEP